MSSEIIEFKDDAGMPVKFTSQDIRERLCPNATDSELALCVELCNRQHLNPFTQDVYLVKYDNAPASIITNYQVFNRRANKQPNYGGIDSGVVVLRDGKVVKKKGSAVYKIIGEQLIGGWAEVKFTDGKIPAYAELALTDYSTGKSNWAKMPGVMIDKCAKAAAWRLAYPGEFRGMYVSEEMDQAQPQPREVAAEVESVEPMVDLQPVRELFKPFMAATALDSAGAMAAICAAVGCTSGSMHDMTLMQARRAASWMEEEIAARKAQPEPAIPEPEPAPVYEPAPAEYATDDDLLGGF